MIFVRIKSKDIFYVYNIINFVNKNILCYDSSGCDVVEKFLIGSSIYIVDYFKFVYLLFLV